MARRSNSRLRICGMLRVETPLHVGGYGFDVETDLPLARNGKDELYVPGTSLTGVLRAWCERNFTEKDAQGTDVPIKLIGEIFGLKRRPGIEEGHASFVLIEDAIVTLPENLTTEIRDGVGIDRFYGTAADGAKYDRAILPKGSTLEFEITVEIAEDEARTKAIFGHLLMALLNEEIRFGAAKTRGLGRVKLVELREIQTQNFKDILSWIGKKDTGKELKSKAEIEAEIEKLNSSGITKQGKPKLEITIEWQPTLPLMVKAGYEGIGVDMLPVTSGTADGKLSLVLAGSSIKGAFRSHAERIMRTLLHCEDKSNSDCDAINKKIKTDGKKFNDQIKEIPFVEELFGAKKEKNTGNSKLGLGALSIDDCYSAASFDQTSWRKVETSKVTKTETINGKPKEVEVSYSEQEIWRAIEEVKNKMNADSQFAFRNPHFQITHHTAIDRFTGGVADGALYSVLAPHNVEWQPIKMSLDFGRTANGKECLMLMLLVLRDLAENRLPLGFATNRGMGEVMLKSIELKGENLAEIVSGDISIEIENGKFTAGDGLKSLGGEKWWENER